MGFRLLYHYAEIAATAPSAQLQPLLIHGDVITDAFEYICPLKFVGDDILPSTSTPAFCALLGFLTNLIIYHLHVVYFFLF